MDAFYSNSLKTLVDLHFGVIPSLSESIDLRFWFTKSDDLRSEHGLVRRLDVMTFVVEIHLNLIANNDVQEPPDTACLHVF